MGKRMNRQSSLRVRQASKLVRNQEQPSFGREPRTGFVGEEVHTRNPRKVEPGIGFHRLETLRGTAKRGTGTTRAAGEDRFAPDREAHAVGVTAPDLYRLIAFPLKDPL